MNVETPLAANGPALETRGLCKSFGALTVADQIDFRLERGARQALIGPNGAGKTTFVELVTGGLPPSAGKIVIDGAEVTELPPAARVKRGVARPFQVSALFRRRTTVLVQGRILVEGPPDVIAADPQVRQVYLGERAHGRAAR